jgi:cysteinyl-tRNA synthetase
MGSKPDIFLWNALSKKKELFVPIRRGKAGMYHCGPTVYDFAHIGNLRSYVFADVLRRTFEAAGYKVKQVINITDIGHLSSDSDDGDDKMMKGLKREGLPHTLEGLKTLADKYEAAFKEDLKLLNIETKGTKFPRASKHLKDDIKLIQELDKKGLVYRTEDGMYFDTSKIHDYGKLGGLTPLDESRARVAENGKKNARDFALWKFSKDGHLGFKSPFGLGYPGWHIECSAMSMKYLGKTFDIHTGGIDHIPVHHNDEIAQSEHATGKDFAHYWMHNAFVTIGGGKMAKSADNFLTLKDLAEKGYDPIAYRYFLLGARYSAPVNFSWEALDGAANALRKLKAKVTGLAAEMPVSSLVRFAKTTRSKTGISAAVAIIYDDLDTPKLLAAIWTMLKSSASSEEKLSFIRSADSILGLGL